MSKLTMKQQEKEVSAIDKAIALNDYLLAIGESKLANEMSVYYSVCTTHDFSEIIESCKNKVEMEALNNKL